MLDVNRTTIDIPSESLSFKSGQVIGNYTIDKMIFEGSQSQSFSIKNDHSKIIKVYFRGEEPDKDLVCKLSQHNNSSLLRIYQYGTYAEHFYCIEKKYHDIRTIHNATLSEQKKVVDSEKNAINAFHSIGYAHLDIKKEHFKCDEYGNVILIDIGYASRVGSRFNKSPNCFSAPEVYAGHYSGESDYYSFGIAVLEQFYPDLFKNKSKQEIMAFVNSTEPLKTADRLPEHIRDDVKTMLADNPSTRSLYKAKPISVTNNSTQVAVHRPNNQPSISIAKLKPLVIYEILELAHKGDAKVFQNKVIGVLKEINWSNPISVNAAYTYFKSVPRDTAEKNYTNLSGRNINKFFVDLKVYTTPNRLHLHNPLKFMRHLRLFKKYYVMDKGLVQRLDKQGAEIAALNEKKAWAILKGIGITIGVIIAVAAAIAVIIVILYILAIIVCIIIVGCILAAIIAIMEG